MAKGLSLRKAFKKFDMGDESLFEKLEKVLGF